MDSVRWEEPGRVKPFGVGGQVVRVPCTAIENSGQKKTEVGYKVNLVLELRFEMLVRQRMFEDRSNI